MLLSLFGKEGYNNLDISVFLEYPPDIVLEFFQQIFINISLNVYQELKNSLPTRQIPERERPQMGTLY